VSWASELRRRRLRYLSDIIETLSSPVTILDIGGTWSFWASNYPNTSRRLKISILNTTLPEMSDADEHHARDWAAKDRQRPEFLIGDARDLSGFSASSVDVCFSNSVIEHVGPLEDQRRMADEVRRVGRSYVIQTPYRYFPIEPHFVMPLWQFLPVGLRVALHRRLDLGWMPRTPDPKAARTNVTGIRLLDIAEMQQLFPDAVIEKERIGPLVKSLIAVRHAGAKSKTGLAA
jgi:hypothetical protein